MTCFAALLESDYGPLANLPDARYISRHRRGGGIRITPGALFSERCAIAKANGFAPSAPNSERVKTIFDALVARLVSSKGGTFRCMA
jgi:hypothetical protein